MWRNFVNIYGLTGGIATGKSTCTKILKKKGLPVLDADKIVHEMYKKGNQVYELLVETFGEDILTVDKKEIDRKKLGLLLFNDPETKSSVEKIVHPAVFAEMEKKSKTLFFRGHLHIIWDVPLLFETKLLAYYDKIITVACDERQQICRLMDRNGFDENEAKKRIKAQLDLQIKKEKSDFVLQNNGSLQDLENSIDKMLRTKFVLSLHKCTKYFFVLFFCVLMIMLFLVSKNDSGIRVKGLNL
eukprot:TRINITY_DN1740_c0_g1_i1.p1 TRINITY_DN1740_c0_g1~~TRINITY_DN1740_c0_g1_i1.p1  ORF type:complete len:243 (+),score=65.21 TRINITY_DN1740_c0_g1_i1:44-772(+)